MSTSGDDESHQDGVGHHEESAVPLAASDDEELDARLAEPPDKPVFVPPQWAPHCVGQCISHDRSHGKDPVVDRYAVLCASCGGWVCVSCGRKPVASYMAMCEMCQRHSDIEAGYRLLYDVLAEAGIDADALLAAAETAARNAYAPRSEVRVGAAAACTNGSIYIGCNVDNRYGLGMCAERVALYAAVAAGHRPRKGFVAIAVVSPDDVPGERLMPCGACLQALDELGGPDLTVYVDGAGALELHSLLADWPEPDHAQE